MRTSVDGCLSSVYVWYEMISMVTKREEDNQSQLRPRPLLGKYTKIIGSLWLQWLVGGRRRMRILEPQIGHDGDAQADKQRGNPKCIAAPAGSKRNEVQNIVRGYLCVGLGTHGIG